MPRKTKASIIRAMVNMTHSHEQQRKPMGTVGGGMGIAGGGRRSVRDSDMFLLTLSLQRYLPFN